MRDDDFDKWFNKLLCKEFDAEIILLK